MMKGRDLLSDQDWTLSELNMALNLAKEMKHHPLDKRWAQVLSGKSFLMLFCNPSLRTHLSFEKAVFAMGGYPHYRTANMGWVKQEGGLSSGEFMGESIQDMAKVISCYVDGLGIRLTMDAISRYGEAQATLREYADWADIPVINMACDTFHPCQGLADIMGWAEALGGGQHAEQLNLEALKGKKLLLAWAKSRLTRPWASVQSHLLLAARMGMQITLAHPEGYALDPLVCAQAQSECQRQGMDFEIIHDPDSGYAGADVVLVRNWISGQAYQTGCFDDQGEVLKALSYSDWMVTENRMRQTENALFANPMPVDRGYEVESSVVDGSRSIIYEVAENRVHIQKAIMALTMGDL